VGDRRLKGIEAIVERQKRVPPEGDDRRFLFGAPWAFLQ